MNFITNSMFQSEPTPPVVPQDTDIIFVNDFFVEDLIGGAELSLEALIETSGQANLKAAKIKSSQVTTELLQEHQNRYWVFASITGIDQNLIPTITVNMKYSLICFDYAFCKYRSIEKCRYAEQHENEKCCAINETFGKLMSTFFYQADSLWFMSEEQLRIWADHFPFLASKNVTVLSSIFNEDFWKKFAVLREKLKTKEIEKNDKYLIQDSNSWIKGTGQSVAYCEATNIPYELLGNVSYDEFLLKLASSKGFIFTPLGKDTCPRVVIEAKLMGCKIIANENVQHLKEEWFDTDNIETTISYLYLCRQRFWNGINHIINNMPTISGYTTTYNCIENGYPFNESIKSLLGFCDEVVVVDAGSNDGTFELLEDLSRQEDKLKVYKKEVNFTKPRWAVELDGHLKAFARSLCTKQYLWQMDSDEVVHESDYKKIKELCKSLPKTCNLLCLPIIEYFGNLDNVRSDVAWKWRLSKNIPHMTHDIPAPFRKFDKQGNVYPEAFKSDTCDYVDVNSYNIIPAMTFYPEEANIVRENNIEEYEKWFNQVIGEYPIVFHFSWFNIERKVKNYVSNNGWQNFHKSMYNLEENNVMFDYEPTDADTKQKAKEIFEHGPHIFHSKMSDETKNKIKIINVNRNHPKIMDEWIKENTRTYKDE